MSVALWQGFDFSWDRAAHRLNALASRIDGDTVHHEFTVGRVPDSGVARTWVTHVDADGLATHHGRSTVTVTAVLGRRATAEATEVCIPLPDGHTGSAVLSGFSLRCASCHVGLHTRGFGIGLASVELRKGTLRFRPQAWVHAANSPDPITTGGGVYSYDVDLEWTALSGSPDHVAFQTQSAILHTHRGSASTTDQELRDTPMRHAVLGVRGLAIEQRWRGRWGRDGRFVRHLQSGVDDLIRATRARFRPHLHFSNRGVITYPIDVEHRLWTTLVGFQSGESKRERVESRIATGIGAGGRAQAPLRG